MSRRSLAISGFLTLSLCRPRKKKKKKSVLPDCREQGVPDDAERRFSRGPGQKHAGLVVSGEGLSTSGMVFLPLSAPAVPVSSSPCCGQRCPAVFHSRGCSERPSAAF